MDIIKLFETHGAIRHGHFILSSNRHSPIYIQKARIFQDPELTEIVCSQLATLVKSHFPVPDYIAAPATAGIIPGYATARQLRTKFVWTDKENKEMVLKRFNIPPNSTVVVVEDILTTGASANQTVYALQQAGADVLGIACIIQRNKIPDLPVPLHSLAYYLTPDYAPGNLPLELSRIPITDPSS